MPAVLGVTADGVLMRCRRPHIIGELARRLLGNALYQRAVTSAPILWRGQIGEKTGCEIAKR